MCQDFGGKPEGKRLCGRSRCRWKDNIGMTFRKKSGRTWTGFIWLRRG
jgi:hypothetical protein